MSKHIIVCSKCDSDYVSGQAGACPYCDWNVKSYKEMSNDLNIFYDALEKIIANCGTGSEGGFIARQTLEKV